MLAWCNAEVVKEVWIFYEVRKRHCCQYQMKRQGLWHPTWSGGGGNTGFSQHSNCCSAGCTCVWRSRKLLNYTPSAGSIGFFDNMHWCHWEQLSSSIAIRHYIFGRKAVNGCFKKKNERKRLNFLLQSAAQQQQIAAVNTRLNGLLGAQWGDRTLDIIMADTGAALCRRRMIHKHGWKKREF